MISPTREGRGVAVDLPKVVFSQDAVLASNGQRTVE